MYIYTYIYVYEVRERFRIYGLGLVGNKGVYSIGIIEG